MIKVTTLLVIAVCLMVIGCQPPEGMAGVSQEDFDALKEKVEMLEADATAMHEAMDGFVEQYNMHIEKHHKGGTTVPKPGKPTRVGGK